MSSSFFILVPPPSSLDEDVGFSPWSSWNPCTKTCTDARNPATKSRHRRCIKPPCSGSSHQKKVCNLPQCLGMNIFCLTLLHSVSMSGTLSHSICSKCKLSLNLCCFHPFNTASPENQAALVFCYSVTKATSQ